MVEVQFRFVAMDLKMENLVFEISLLIRFWLRDPKGRCPIKLIRYWTSVFKGSGGRICVVPKIKF